MNCDDSNKIKGHCMNYSYALIWINICRCACANNINIKENGVKASNGIMRIWNGNTKARRVGSVVDSEIRCTGNHKLNICVKVISAFIFVVEKSFGEVRECNFMNEHRLIAVSCLILSEFIDIPSEWLKVVLF